MQVNNTRGTTLLFCILLIVIIITISYYDPRKQLPTLFIYAEKDNKGGDDDDQKQIEEKKGTNFEDKKNSLQYTYTNIKIPQIYQKAANGSTYKFNSTNPNAKTQLDEEKDTNIFTKKNNDGSWRIDGGKPRIDIFTKDAGVLSNKQILQENFSNSIVQSWNYSELKDIGYWYKPTDWKNVEISLIFKLIDSSRSKGNQHDLSLVTRSISHSVMYGETSKGDPPFYCGGSSYHNNLSNDGNVRMKKEEFHVDYERERYNPNIQLGEIYNKIIGFKGVVYNINDTSVKMETWVDLNNAGKGPYKKIHEKIDNGDWGDNMKVCGARTNGQAITWGSPLVIIKSNDFKFDIYDIQINEIIPPSSK
ncbi:MAG: hypothetical protein ACR2F1_06730 [Nitrososphaeraceae archaeon]